MSCSDVCPVKVDLAEQIYKWRQDLDGLGKANTGKKIMSGGMKFLMERPALFNAAFVGSPGGKWPAPFHEIQRSRRLGKGA